MVRKIFIIKVFFLLAVISTYELGAMSSELLYAQDKIIAIVNNDVITQKDLDDFMHFTRMQLSREYKGKKLEEKLQSLRMNLLDRLIEDRLILQEAKKSDIRIEEAMIKGRINDIKKRYSSDSDFQNDLAKQGLVQADLENKIREQLFMYNIVEFKVKSKIQIKPDEITQFYRNNKNDFMSPEERQITVVSLENSDQAQSFSYGLKTGQEITDLAARYPVTIDTIMVGEGGTLRQEIEQVVMKLSLREISNPVEIEGKYYIFILENIIPPRQLILQEVQTKIHDFLSEQKMQQELDKWLDELKKQSYIKIS